MGLLIMAKKKFYKKKAKTGPSRGEQATEAIEKEVLQFWKDIGNSELGSWDKPWLLNMLKAEDGGKFLNQDKRYVYKGSFNQWLIAFYSQVKDPEKGSIVLTKTEILKAFGLDPEKKDDFKKSPLYGQYDSDGNYIKDSSIKTMGNLFRPFQRKLYSAWKHPDGRNWSSPDEKRTKPTRAEINDLGLKDKGPTTTGFMEFPVWSMSDIYPVLNDEQKNKIDELVALRSKIGYEFNPEDDIEKFIESMIDDTIERMGIESKTGGNQAYYVPTRDDITLPGKDQFKNPIVRYAVYMHELAHSTMHIHGRRPSARDKADYGREEIVAETTAVMMVKRLEIYLEPMMKSGREDITKMFEDYYANAMTYNDHWGHKIDFATLIADFETQYNEQAGKSVKDGGNPGMLKSIMTDISKCVDSLANGEYSFEQRAEFKVENFNSKKWDKDRELEAINAIAS